MQNATIFLKIKQRLNKLASQDYDNLECWQLVEAFNKAQISWLRSNLHGTNRKQEGDEQSKTRIDDFQVLLNSKPKKLNFANRGIYSEAELPSDYLTWKRISVSGKNDCCEDRPFMVYLVPDADVDILLRDPNKQPDFEWAETFCTLASNKVKVYTDKKFSISEGFLFYYRQPRRIEVLGCSDPYSLVTSTAEVTCELKMDLIELIIDEAVTILSGDIESMNQHQIASINVERNN